MIIIGYDTVLEYWRLKRVGISITNNPVYKIPEFISAQRDLRRVLFG